MLKPRLPAIEPLYFAHAQDENLSEYARSVGQIYTVGTLERLARAPARSTRRAAVLALGLLADFASNDVLGRALVDQDRGVRLAAENASRMVWCRDGNNYHRQQLALIVRANNARRHAEAIVRGTALVEQAPWFAEGWNQRAIGYFGAGHYHESIRDCRKALELNPYHFGAAAGIGQCFLHLNEVAPALEAFRRALKLNPGLEGVRATAAALERKLNNM